MLLVRAVVTGFGLSLGAALFKEVQRRLGYGEEDKDKDKKKEETLAQDGATDPALRG